MADVLIRETEPGDVDELIANLRDCDRLEVEASAGRHRVERAIRLGVRCSFGTMTSLVDGRVANMFGVTPLDFVQGRGSPWMLATPVFDVHPRAVIRLCRTYIPPMLALFPHLINHVDARNTRSIAWLTWLGFEIHAPEPFGPYGVPFHKFEMKADHV